MNNTGISTEALQQQLMQWAAQPFAAAGTVPTSREDDVENYYGGYDESLPYWEEQGWVPTMKSGKQRTPNMIRNELQRFLDQSNETQTAILERMGVNSNSFRRFMNPKTYKNQWSAVDNGTYWAAAKLLEAERGKKKEAAPSKKRKATTNDGVAGPVVSKKSKAELKWDVVAKMNRINSVAGVHESIVYDSCPEIVKKIKAFLDRDGVTKTDFCEYALVDVNCNSLSTFLAGKGQDKAANITYQRAWAFFERQRLAANAPKSHSRLKNEQEHPHGFSLLRPRPARTFGYF